MRQRHYLSAFALSAVMLAGCNPLSTVMPKPTAAPTSTPAPTDIPEPTAEPTPAALTPDQIASKLQASTVMIRADFPATPLSDAGTGSGTGIVISDDGYIVTNAHVVQGASSWTVSTSGSSASRPAKLIGSSSCDDLALLKVDDTSDLSPATLGSNGDISVGEEVVALGYPDSFELGNKMSVTRGIVSQIDRHLDNYDSLIQTDAAINHGNSGGPLVNTFGNVIGVNTLGKSDATNINFAISINKAKSVVEMLKQGTRSQWLGLNLEPNNWTEANDFFGYEGGLIVVGVDSGSPAKKVGIQPADLLVSIEDTDVNTMGDVCKILRSHSDGDRLQLNVLRVGEANRSQLRGEIAISDTKADMEPLAETLLDVPTDGQAGDPAAADTSTQDPNVNYNEYLFQSDDGSWDTYESDSASITMGGGFYSIVLKDPNLYGAWNPTDIADANDMAIIADMQIAGNARAGVATRHTLNGDAQSYYACWIDSNNQFGCVNYNDGQLTTLQEATTSDAIKAGQANRLMMVSEGTTTSFSINGTDVASFENTTLTHGIPAIYAENFDDKAGVDVSYAMILTPK